METLACGGAGPEDRELMAEAVLLRWKKTMRWDSEHQKFHRKPRGEPHHYNVPESVRRLMVGLWIASSKRG